MPTRRLTAIMFADIVGYTAMMQQDEAKGIARASQLRRAIEELLPQHGGELVEMRGDGAFCLFGSSTEAVYCAQKIQQWVSAEVPLRIGLHLGDITQQDGHIFGDAVNIASRIESMGVPGSVLLSSSIRQQIKNKPEFELESLGKFAFKNVAEPMTVYALANEGLMVPDAKEMQGKGKKVKEEKVSARNWIRMASIGFVAMAAGAAIFWATGSANPSQAGQLDAKIRQERVAAIPFNNRTGDANLDAFGALCSDLITNGLTEAGIKVCSPRTIHQYSHLIGILPDNAEGKPAFSEVVGARYLIDGSFLRRKEQLILTSQLIDGFTGDVIRTFPEISGDENNKEGLSDSLTRRIMGFWVAKEEIEKGKFKPPLYKAYQEYRKGRRLYDGSVDHRWVERKHSRRAYEMDSSFYLAAIHEMFWTSIPEREDSLMASLEPHIDRMTPYEKKFFEASKAFGEGDWSTLSKTMEEMLEMFPEDVFVIEHLSYTLAHRENQPTKAWEIASRLDLDHLPPGMEGWRMFQTLLRCEYGLMVGKYEAVLEEIGKYLKPMDEPMAQGTYYQYAAMALVRSGQMERLDLLLEEAKMMPKAKAVFWPEFAFIQLCNRIGNDLLVKGEADKAQTYLHMAREWALSDPERMESLYDSLALAETYRLLGRPKEALSLELPYWDLHTSAPYNQVDYFWWVKGNFLSGIAIDYALIGDLNKAEEIAQYLKNRTPDVFGARIYAVLNQKGKAVECLQREPGRYVNDAYWFKNDPYMKNLFGYEPYEELIRPKN